jgi:hypothetical protein
VAIYSAIQSNLFDEILEGGAGAGCSAGGRVRTSGEWLAHYRANGARPRPVPWGHARLSDSERDAVGRSLQSWQLGETSDARHLRAAAARHAARTGDADFPAAIDLFIKEEQRHGELLGQFLDRAGVGRVRSDWGDTLFRAARYCLPNMEAWTIPVVMIEVVALVYYNAVRRATRSAALRAICAQILADEVPHIRFQCERLALILRPRPPLLRWLTLLAHRPFFLVVILLVWLGHRRALRAGGYGWRAYWRTTWSHMRAAWRLMDPRRYAWGP